MVRLAEGFAALQEEKQSAQHREAGQMENGGQGPGQQPSTAGGRMAAKARARQANPHRKRAAVRESDMAAAERFTAEKDGVSRG